MSLDDWFTDENAESNSDSTAPSRDKSGSSKFVLFPIATSVFDSTAHTFVAMVIALVAGSITAFFGSHPIVWVISAVLLYTLGLSAFKYGERPEYFGDEMDEYPFLIAISGISIPVTMTIGYLLLENPTQLRRAIVFIVAMGGTWFMNRRLYVTLKEDIVVHGFVTSHSWLFATRLPSIALLTTSIVANVSAFLWVILLGYSTAVSFAYGVVRVMVDEPTQESTWEQEWNSTSTNNTVTHETSSNTETDTDETNEDDSPTTETTDPEDQLENYDKAKELTNGLKDAVQAVNAELEREGLTKYNLPEVSGQTIPPETQKARAIHEAAKELNDYLLRYDEDNRDLRRHVLEVQQHIQEIDEFIYTDIEAPVYR